MGIVRKYRSREAEAVVDSTRDIVEVRRPCCPECLSTDIIDTNTTQTAVYKDRWLCQHCREIFREPLRLVVLDAVQHTHHYDQCYSAECSKPTCEHFNDAIEYCNNGCKYRVKWEYKEDYLQWDLGLLAGFLSKYQCKKCGIVYSDIDFASEGYNCPNCGGPFQAVSPVLAFDPSAYTLTPPMASTDDQGWVGVYQEVEWLSAGCKREYDWAVAHRVRCVTLASVKAAPCQPDKWRDLL
jgi:hypothetical protein